MMAHQHHLTQLTAHSQLTNLEPGQIQCIRLPPTATFLTYPGYTTTPIPQPQQQNRLRNTTPLAHIQGLVTRAGGCAICLGGLPPRITRRSTSGPAEFFVKVCELLQIPWNEIQHEWTFEASQKLPFCGSCLDVLQELIGINDQLAILKKKVTEGVEAVRSKIRLSNTRISTFSDFKTFNFRNKALASSFMTTPAAPVNYIFDPIPEVILHEQPPVSDADTAASPDLQQYDSSTQTEIPPIYETIEFIPHSQDASDTCMTTNEANLIFDLQLDPNPEEVANENTTVNIRGMNQVSRMERVMNRCGITEGSINIENSSTRQGGTLAIVKSAQPIHINNGTYKPSTKSKKGVKSSISDSQKVSSRKKTREHFAQVEKVDQDRLLFEGITITSCGTGYTCGKCGWKCGKRSDSMSLRKMKIHIKGVHLGAYNCDLCGKKFSSKDILDQHKFRSHEQENTPCDICKRPVRPRYLNSHKFTHMNAEEKESYIAETGFKPTLYTNTVKKYPCATCGKLFSKRSILVRHEATHISMELRKTFECDKCEKKYKTEQALKEHKSLRHDAVRGIRKSLCKECGAYVHPKYLRNHLNSHLAKEERPFVCKICRKRFVSQKSLTRHEADHKTGDTEEMYKYECNVCGQRFLSKKSKNNHRNKSHDNQQSQNPRKSTLIMQQESENNIHLKSQKKPTTAKRTNDSGLKIKCKCLECDATFNDFDKLEQHTCSSRDQRGTKKIKLKVK